MSKFTEDLKMVCFSAAEDFRSYVVSEDDERRHREMRQEAQFVAEIYHRLQTLDYISNELFMEYLYSAIQINGKKRKLKPDLILENEFGDEVLEFGVFWDGDLYKNGSSLIGTAQNKVQNYYTKLLAYRELPNKISTLTVMFAYLGPDVLENGSTFAIDDFG